MINWEQKYKQLEKQFGILENEELIKQVRKLIVNPKVNDFIKSKALSLAGNIICHLAPAQKEDYGYSYFNEALELDSNNYDARLGICAIFNTYPYPFCNVVTEIEYLENIEKLINDFDELGESQKANTLETVRVYSLYRKKVIEKYGYPLNLIEGSYQRIGF